MSGAGARASRAADRRAQARLAAGRYHARLCGRGRNPERRRARARRGAGGMRTGGPWNAGASGEDPMKFVSDLLTGKDNLTYDAGRVIGVLGALMYVAFWVVQVVATWRFTPGDADAYARGLGM